MLSVPVPARLSRFVRSLRVFADMDALLERPSYRRLPDGETELTVRFGEAGTTASVIGTRTRVLEKPASGAQALLIRFRLGGAHPFFGRPLSELTDQVVPLEDLWSKEASLRLAAARDANEVAASLAAVLERGATYDPPSARTVRRALQLIDAADVPPRVPQLAADLGVSERQLRRGFAEVIGLSPKHYLRVARFRKALRVARAASAPDWAAIASQVGYYDQAHLIADFREMTGVTPGALFMRT
jgi:AraC-like DNA-binding protein